MASTDKSKYPNGHRSLPDAPPDRVKPAQPFGIGVHVGLRFMGTGKALPPLESASNRGESKLDEHPATAAAPA